MRRVADGPQEARIGSQPADTGRTRKHALTQGAAMIVGNMEEVKAFVAQMGMADVGWMPAGRPALCTAHTVHTEWPSSLHLEQAIAAAVAGKSAAAGSRCSVIKQTCGCNCCTRRRQASLGDGRRRRRCAQALCRRRTRVSLSRRKSRGCWSRTSCCSASAIFRGFGTGPRGRCRRRAGRRPWRPRSHGSHRRTRPSTHAP
jgi:hypothetical protein